MRDAVKGTVINTVLMLY